MIDATPRCPIYGECGGCKHQHITYASELLLKQNIVREWLNTIGMLSDEVFDPIIASPNEYNYRNRLDLSLLKTRDGEVHIGFRAEGQSRLIPTETCSIAQQSIVNFFPDLREQAIKRLPQKYRLASLVVKTDDAGRVLWGGIGRHSLQLPESEYLWTEVDGKRIHYSLDTFFQVNSSILPKLFKKIREWIQFGSEHVFLDLYGGVGLFTVGIAKDVKKSILVESSKNSIVVANYNVRYLGLQNVEVIESKVEDVLADLLIKWKDHDVIAMIDPPRKGLSETALHDITSVDHLKTLLYLSCNPETLARDLKVFVERGWQIKKVCALDFFPKTKHVETLALLTHKGKCKAQSERCEKPAVSS